MINEVSLRKLENYLLKHGITSFIPTFYSIPFKNLKKNLQFYRDYIYKYKNNTCIAGVNLEGPFLNKKQCGSHNKKYLKNFKDSNYINLIKEFRDIIRIITISPEIPFAIKYIKLFSNYGIKVMLGHTLADFQQSMRAFSAGASGVTHFYNKITPFHHRNVGLMGAVFLNENVFVELIADGLHTSKQALQIALKNIPLSKVIIVSDSIARPEGARLVRGFNGCKGYMDRYGNFIGGSSNLLGLLFYIVKKVGIKLEEAWNMVSTNPGVFIDEKQNFGVVKKGKKADLLIVSKKMKIEKVIKSGEVVCAE